MAKTRLTTAKREAIYQYMKRHFVDRVGSAEEDALREHLVRLINVAIRIKYPEEDMAVLRKYRCTFVDRCLRFQQTSNGRFFGINLYDNADGIADMARNHGCNSGDVFPVGDELVEIHERHEGAVNARKSALRKKFEEYQSFVLACKTVEDVEAVVPLPADLRLKLTGSRTALVAVSPDTVANLKAEFAELA